MDAERITVGGQILTGSDRFGDWKVNRLEGWWDSPDVKDESEERPEADGDYDLEVYYKARYVTISGRLLAPSHDQLHEGMNRFTGLVQKKARLSVIGHGANQWADVKRASGLSIIPRTDRLAQWQMRLKAPDPRKYGERRTFIASVGSSAQGVHHRGNYPATCKFDVAGAMPGGYRLTIKGQIFQVTRALVSGQPHNIDFGTGRLRVNGVIVPGGIGWGFKPLVTPGVPTALAIEPLTAGTATATLTLLDTFI